MKKIILAIILVFISSIVFADDLDDEKFQPGFMMEHRGYMSNREDGEQMRHSRREKIGKIEIEALRNAGLSEENIQKAIEIVEREQKSMKLKRLDIDAKRIEIEREMLKEKKD